MPKSNNNSSPIKSARSAASSETPIKTPSSSSTPKTIAQVPASRVKAEVLLQHGHVGMQLLKHARFKQTQLRFDRKLPRTIAQRLRQAGWVWRGAEGVYTLQFGNQSEAAAIEAAKQLYAELYRELSAGILAGAD